jgi:hypothetical protein
MPGRIESSVREHRDIVSAIAAHDPQRAEDLVRVHIRNAYDARVQLITQSLDVAARQPVATGAPIAISPQKSKQRLSSAERTSEEKKCSMLKSTMA